MSEITTGPVAVIACGALTAKLRQIASSGGFPVELHPLSPLLHDHPEKIAPEIARLASALKEEGRSVAVAYADCGTYGALDDVCCSLGLERLPGLHCYDVLAGPDEVRRLFSEEPGTYILTDFLVRSFRRSVIAELGLDRYPQLVADYFGNYKRIVWLTETGSASPQSLALSNEVKVISELLGLPLQRIEVGTSRLQRALERLLTGANKAAGPGAARNPSAPAC
jgi:Protein of unknown function (DUF1638)